MCSRGTKTLSKMIMLSSSSPSDISGCSSAEESERVTDSREMIVTPELFVGKTRYITWSLGMPGRQNTPTISQSAKAETVATALTPLMTTPWSRYSTTRQFGDSASASGRERSTGGSITAGATLRFSSTILVQKRRMLSAKPCDGYPTVLSSQGEGSSM